MLAAMALLAVLLASLPMYWIHSSQPATAAVRTVLAQEIISADPLLADESAWVRLILPDRLCRADCTSHYKIYRATIPTPADNEPTAIYLPMFEGSAAVYLNGAKIGQSGSTANPIADMTYQPMLLELPTDRFIAEHNRLEIIVASVIKRGGQLVPFFTGVTADLKDAYTPAAFLTVDMLAVYNGIFLVIGVLVLLLYFAGDKDRLYLWSVLLLIFCSLRNTNIVLPEWPAEPVMRHSIYLVSTLGVLLSSAGFISRLASRRESVLDIVLIAALLPVAILIYVGISTDLWTNWVRANIAIQIVAVGLGPIMLIRFLIHARSFPINIQSAIFSLLLLALLLLLHDIWFTRPPRILQFQLSNLAALPVVLSLCVALVYRYSNHLATIRIHNQQLRSAVLDREQELSRSYATIREKDRQKVLGEERQRIMQDMHDGVGGRLATILQQLRHSKQGNGAISDELQQSIHDLRLIIDSLDENLGNNLGIALGNYRARIEPWLQEQGLHLDWSVNVGDPPGFGPAQILQIYRCLQEALNNVLRHANATRVRVQGEIIGEEVRFEVRDDGHGFDTMAGKGRGLVNISNRIESLGGSFEVQSDSTGTVLAISLPVAHP